MNSRNSTKRFLLGLLLVLGLQLPVFSQTTDSVSVLSESNRLAEEPIPAKTGKEPEAAPVTEKTNPKLIAAVCLFIITTTLLLYHVRSQ